MILNEMLLYGGIVMIGCSIVGMIVSVSVLKIKKIHLGVQLEKEYGEK